MDPTLLAAVAGVLGVIIGAVIGGIFALKATKRQVEVMLLQSFEPRSRGLPAGLLDQPFYGWARARTR